MNEEPKYKFVDFTMCNTCKHFTQPENDEPCFTCLLNATNLGSIKPVNYEEKKGILTK